MKKPRRLSAVFTHYQTYQEIEIHFNFIGQFRIPVSEEDMEATPTVRPEEPIIKHVENNSRFLSLQAYLEDKGESIELTFAEIEGVIGKKLSKSAYKYRSYWYPAKNRPVGNIIYNAGYDIAKLGLKGQKIRLKKVV